MSQSNWLRNAAFVGCLIAAMVTVAPVLGQPPNKAVEAEKADNPNTEAANPPSAEDLDIAFWKDHQGDSRTYEAICEKPRTKDYADLCQQWRSAEAAKQQLYWSRNQFWIGVASTAGLILTLAFTGWAALAASRAAKAADKAVEVAEGTAKHQLRAYLSMSPKLAGGFLEGEVVRIEFSPNNHGQTPAHSVRHVFEVAILPHPLPVGFTFPPAERESNNRFTVYPDSDVRSWFTKSTPITLQEVDDVRANRARLHCWGATYYSDIFGKEHKVKFITSAGGENFVRSQELYRDGQRENFPDWKWEYGPGHGLEEE